MELAVIKTIKKEQNIHSIRTEAAAKTKEGSTSSRRVLSHFFFTQHNSISLEIFGFETFSLSVERSVEVMPIKDAERRHVSSKTQRKKFLNKR